MYAAFLCSSTTQNPRIAIPQQRAYTHRAGLELRLLHICWFVGIEVIMQAKREVKKLGYITEDAGDYVFKEIYFEF